MSSRTSPATSSLVLMSGNESKSDSSRDRQFSESTRKVLESNENYKQMAEDTTGTTDNLFDLPYSTHDKNKENSNNNNTNISCSTSLAFNTTVPSPNITLEEETTTTSSSSATTEPSSSYVDSSALTTSPESFLSSIVAFHSETTTPELNRYVQEIATYSHSPCSSQQEWSLHHINLEKQHEQEERDNYKRRERKIEMHKWTPTHKHLGKNTTHWEKEKEQPLLHNALKHQKLKHISTSVKENGRQGKDHNVEEAESLSRIHWASPSEVLELRNTCHALMRKHENEVNSLRSALHQSEVEQKELTLQLEKVAELKHMYEKGLAETNKEKQRYLKWRAEREVMNVHLQKFRIENERQKWLLSQKHNNYLSYNTSNENNNSSKRVYSDRTSANTNNYYNNEESERNEEKGTRNANNNTQRETVATRTHEPFTECEPVNDKQLLECQHQEIHDDSNCIKIENNNKERKNKESTLYHVHDSEHSKALINQLSSHLLQRRSQSCPINVVSKESALLVAAAKEYENKSEVGKVIDKKEHTALPESKPTHVHLDKHEAILSFPLSSQSSTIPTPSSLHSTSTSTSSYLHRKVNNNNNNNLNKTISGEGCHETTSPTEEKIDLLHRNEEDSHTNADPSVTTPITSLTTLTSTTVRDATLPPSSEQEFASPQDEDNKVSNLFHSSESVLTPSSLHSSFHTGEAKDVHLRSLPSVPSSSSTERTSSQEHQSSINSDNSKENKVSSYSSPAIRAVRRTCSPAPHQNKSIAHINEQSNNNTIINQKDNPKTNAGLPESTREITVKNQESISETNRVTSDSIQNGKTQTSLPLSASHPPRLPSSSPSELLSSSSSSSLSPEPFSSASPLPLTSPSPTNTNHDTNTNVSSSLSVLYHMPRTPAEALKESIALIQEQHRLAAQVKELQTKLQASKESNKMSEQKWEYTLQDSNEEISALRKQLQRVQDKVVELDSEKEHLSNKLRHVEEALQLSKTELQRQHDNQHAQEESMKQSFTAAITQKQDELDATLHSVEVKHAKELELAEVERHEAVKAMQQAKEKLNTLSEQFAMTENALQREIHSLHEKQVELGREHENELQVKVNENVQLRSRADELERELLIARNKLTLLTDDMSILQREQSEMKVLLDSHANTIERVTTHNSELKRRIVEMQLLHEVIARLEIKLESADDELAIQKQMYMEQLAEVTDASTHNKKCYTKEINRLSKKCKEFANLFRLISEASDNLSSHACNDKPTKSHRNVRSDNFILQGQKERNTLDMELNKQPKNKRSGVNANVKTVTIQNTGVRADTPCKLQCDMLELMQSSAKAAKQLSNSICNIN